MVLPSAFRGSKLEWQRHYFKKLKFTFTRFWQMKVVLVFFKFPLGYLDYFFTQNIKKCPYLLHLGVLSWPPNPEWAWQRHYLKKLKLTFTRFGQMKVVQFFFNSHSGTYLDYFFTQNVKKSPYFLHLGALGWPPNPEWAWQ